MSFAQFFLAVPRKIMTSLEDNKTVPTIYYLAVFFSALILRNFIEGFTQRGFKYLDDDNIIYILGQLHANLSLTSGAIALVILFHLATRVEIIKIIRVVAPCFLILLITPLVDFIVSSGQGFTIRYLGEGPSKGLLTLFFTFFHTYPGVTPGMKFELIIALYLCFSYFIIKGRSILFSLIYTILVYALIFVYFSAPLIVKFIFLHLGMEYQFSAILMLRFYLLITLFLFLTLIFLQNKSMFMTIFKDMRWARITHYILMLILGVAVALNSAHLSLSEVEPEFICNFLFTVISIISAALFSIITNNIADYAIDKISNSNRPLVKKQISIEVYKNISMAAFFIAIIYAAAASFKILLIIIMIMSTYFIYSMPPLRLKRVPVISKLVVSFNSLSVVLAGYLLVTNSTINFPSILVPIFLIGFTIAANFIDIKDIEGDKAENISTLPVLIGINATKVIVSVAFVMIYLSFYFIATYQYIIYILLMGSAIQTYIIFIKDNDEKYIFGFYLFYLALFIGLLRY